MSSKSPFGIQKALIGIGGEPKSVKRLRSGDLLIETLSALQTKSFLLAKTFLNSSVTISPHKTLNSCHGIISKPDLLTTPEAEILEGFSNQGVIQVRRITIKKDKAVIPTKHIILTFSSPTLPQAIKAGYLNYKIPISTSSSSTQAELLPSTCAKAATVSKPEPPIPISNDLLSNNIFTPIESSSNVSTSLSNDIQPPSTSNTIRDSKQNSKTRIRKQKKELLKKLNEEKIEIKMAPYRRRKPASTEYTTDEEDMITYDVEEEELEPNPHLVEKDRKQYWKGSLLLTPTRSGK
ncbi:putative RNA-directed DNA polymerase from transposon BS [Trichonephila clavipes]|nr:putative RNA-directed DNA polymerase from transposon BS [Trichonephila clavipes]